jgi:hypothetical protein
VAHPARDGGELMTGHHIDVAALRAAGEHALATRDGA